MARLIVVLNVDGANPALEDPQDVAENLLADAESEYQGSSRFSLSRAEWADGIETLDELVRDEEDE